MNEFNFFGSKGILKNVEDVIEERVQIRITDEKEEVKRKKEYETQQKALNDAVQLHGDETQRAKRYRKIAEDALESHRKLSIRYEKTKKELDLYRRREERRALVSKYIERAKNTSAKDEVSDPKPEKIESAASESPKGTDKNSGDKII